MFASKDDKLKEMMKKSRHILPWQDYATVDEGREKRNGVAHRREILERASCWKYLDAIEAELVSWGIVGKVTQP